MPNLSLGTIEVLGLPAAVEAADVALKTADVTLIGYETTDGMGMVAVKIEGQVSAVQSAISAARAAAEKITKVFAVSVIPRPSDQLEPVVMTELTVGLERPTPAEPAPAEPVETPGEATDEVSTGSTSEEPPVESTPSVEPVETPGGATDEVSTSSTSDESSTSAKPRATRRRVTTSANK